MIGDDTLNPLIITKTHELYEQKFEDAVGRFPSLRARGISVSDFKYFDVAFCDQSIMVPMKNTRGEQDAWLIRTASGMPAKYVVEPVNAVITVFNYFDVLKTFMRTQPVVVFESPFDVIACHGQIPAVALTSLTADLLNAAILEKLVECSFLILALDTDVAGEGASARLLNKLAGRASIVQYRDYLDIRDEYDNIWRSYANMRAGQVALVPSKYSIPLWPA